MNTIFVYGLLKPGLRLYGVVEPFVVRAERALAAGRLYDAGIPAARFDEIGEIEGYVFWLDAARMSEALTVLDELEDEGDEYQRVVIDVSTEEAVVSAFAYEYLRSVDGAKPVGSSWPS